MTDRKKQVDRRQHTRFRVREGGYAVLRPHCTVVGELIDVSKGGLAFRYIANERRPSQSSGIDILFAGNSYSLHNVPFKTISDFVLPSEFCSGSATTKRYSVQFEKLTKDQIGELECFIANHTKRDV